MHSVRAPLAFVTVSAFAAVAAIACSGVDANGMLVLGDAATGPFDAGAGAVAPDAAPAPSPDAATIDGAIGDAGKPAPSPSVAVVTTDDLAIALAPTSITTGDTGNADATITLDATTKHQSIVGFGASITDSSSYVLTKHLSAAALHDTLVKLFDPSQGIGLTLLRQPMGASDFSSVGNFSYDDTPNDTTLAKFNIDQDLKATAPVLKAALAIAPDLFIVGTPWSPPAWMKLNGSMNGSGGASGNSGLDGAAYAPFAQYFVKFVKAYAAQGIVVSAVAPQNEPQNGTAAYPGMDFNEPSELSFIAYHLGPAFKAAGLTTKIWAFDHNWDNESYAAGIMADANASGFTEGAAFHCYGGDPSAMTTFHEAYPTKSIYMTECSGGDWQKDPFAATIDLAIDSTANWARAVSLWNMVLDENKGPQNHGCSSCRGVVTVDSASGKVTYNADYYALGHFSRFVRPGAVRIASTSSAPSLKHVAFVNTDGRVAVIMHNTGSAPMAVRVGSGASALGVRVPANGAVTLSFKQP